MRYSSSLLVVSFFFASMCPQSDSWNNGSFELSYPSYGYSLIRANFPSSTSPPAPAYSGTFTAGFVSPRFPLNSQANCQKFLGAC
jgi:hypothetical protein